MKLRSRKGEAVTLAIMGVMMVGGLFLWMFSEPFHMSGMHGGRHPAPEVRSGDHHGGARDAREGHAGEAEDEVSGRDRPAAHERGEKQP
jgi:hypothetical protein